MKQLSIEQKAKAYDEVKKSVESLLFDAQIRHSKSVSVDALADIIPELTESEDESIRKAMINYFTNGKEYLSLTPYSKEDYIAWLEKHGEQKSMKTCAEYYNKDSELKMPELSVFQNKLADILMQREYEGSTETEEDVASARLDYELAAIRISEELLPLAIMQKPAEWSEDDEKRLKVIAEELARFISTHKYGTPLSVDDITWLKSLRTQTTWKPSGEQMRVLDLAIRCGINRGTTEEITLVSLFNDLKKLTE